MKNWRIFVLLWYLPILYHPSFGMAYFGIALHTPEFGSSVYMVFFLGALSELPMTFVGKFAYTVLNVVWGSSERPYWCAGMSPDRSLFTQLIKINLNTLSLLNHLLLTKVKKTPYERFTESFSPLVLKVCVFSADIRPFCKPYRYPAAVFEYLAEIYENSGLSGRISDQPNNWCILGYRTSLIFFLNCSLLQFRHC